MKFIMQIFFFILCSLAAGYIIHLVYLRMKRNRRNCKHFRSEDQLDIIGNDLTGGMIYRIIARKDGSREFIYVSRGIKDIHGLTPEQVTADASLIYNQIHPEDRNMMMEAEKQAVDNMSHFDIEARFINIQDETRWVRIISHPTLLKNGTMAFDGIEIDITERKIAEEKLKNSEENYRNIINNIQDIFYRADLEGNLVMASPSIKKFLWFETAEEYIGINTVESFYYNPSDRELLLGILEKEGAVTDFETILRKKDGSLFTASINSHYYYDKDGNIAGVEGIVRDITERKRAEELFSVAFHENPCPMTITEAGTGRFLEVNRAWCKILEYDWKDIEGKTADELIVYSNPEDPVRLMNSLINTGKIPGIEIDLVSKTGRKIKGVFFAELVKTGNKTVALATMLDITEQQRLRQESMQNALSFKTVFESSPYSIVINRVSDGTFVMVNPTFEKTTGYTATEVIGKNGNDLKLYENSDYAIPDYQQIIATGRIDNAFRETIIKSGEKRYTMYSTRIIDFNGEPCFLSTTSDMTETRKIQEQLNHAQKMDAIGQLAGGIAHDFNNMLGGIMGATELLYMYSENAEKRERYINLIKSTAERASDLTAKLLAFSRKNEPELIPVDIHKILDDTSELLFRTVDRKIDVKLDLNAEESIVKGDMSQLMNIFLNLGINAGHAMPDGGTLKFSTRTAELDETWCRINSPDITPGRYIIVEVHDTGHGIPQESMSRIFDPFFTTSGKGKGTGLGLSAAYGNVKQHHGTITVYSEPGVGSVFHVYLPLTGETAYHPLNSRELIRGRGVILVIDDEEIMRITAREILQYLGYEVLAASNGREGVDIYRKEHGRIDAVLLDMVMPVMNGDECFRELKAINPGVKVIISSGFLLDHNLDEIKRGGVKSFIKKPYQTTELSRILAGLLSE